VGVDDPAYGCTPDGCDPCVVQNAMAACQDGACVPQGCMPGFGDCDMDGSCETSTTTSSQHCGGCNQPCPGTTCVGGTCSNEACTNGLDDDSDGLADCADPDCVGFMCVEVQPPWKGPVFLYDGAFATKPDCSTVPGMLEYEGFDGLMFDAPTCTACSCGAPMVTCGLSDLTTYSDVACTVTTAVTAQPQPVQCTNLGGVVAAASAGPPTVSGSCPPAGGDVTADPYTWQTAGVACEPADQGGGCAGMGVCVGNAPPPFGSKACIYRNGDQSCPAGFDDKHTFFDGADDTRACSSCQCGAPSGSATCDTHTHVYPNAGCAGGASDVFHNSTCTPVSAASFNVEVNVTNNFGACTESGGMPVGDVSEAGTTTVCCVP
jgi:hypothetical protein